MLLLTDDEEASFWMFVGFVEDVANGVICRSGINLYAQGKFIDAQIALQDQDLAAHLNEGHCRPSVLAAGFLTRFALGILPTESALRVWDALILEGAHVLAPLIVATLRTLKDTLLACDPKDIIETFDTRCERLFDITALITDAITEGRTLYTQFDTLSVRCGERQIAADASVNAHAFRNVIRELSNAYGPEGIRRMETFMKSDLEAVIARAYSWEIFQDIETAIDKSYAARELVMAYDLAVRHADADDEAQKNGLRFDVFMRAVRVKSTTSSKMKMLGVKGSSVESRARAFILGADASDDIPSAKSIKMALLVANGVIPTQSLSSAPVESDILRECCNSTNWFSEMRVGTRSALIMSNFTIPLFLDSGAVEDADVMSSSAEAFDVTIIGTRERTGSDTQRMLASLMPMPHTEYLLCVQLNRGIAPFVVKKRFSDFKEFHEKLKSSGCYNIMRTPFKGGAIGTDAALSVDPHVVAVRAVTLQNYLDQLNACGLRKTRVALRAFLGLEAPRTPGGAVSRIRAACACSPRASCAGLFTSVSPPGASNAAWNV
jgi:hypothetical protein